MASASIWQRISAPSSPPRLPSGAVSLVTKKLMPEAPPPEPPLLVLLPPIDSPPLPLGLPPAPLPLAAPLPLLPEELLPPVDVAPSSSSLPQPSWASSRRQGATPTSDRVFMVGRGYIVLHE